MLKSTFVFPGRLLAFLLCMILSLPVILLPQATVSPTGHPVGGSGLLFDRPSQYQRPYQICGAILCRAGSPAQGNRLV